jgi:adenylate kinase family enzyme
MSYSYPIDAILLLGPTGAGKSPLGDLLARNGLLNRRCRHLDFGHELRSAVSDRKQSAAYSAEELAFMHGVLEHGLLLENEHFSLAEKIITLFLNRTGFSQKDILVLNGIPRHEGQAKDMGRIAAVHALIVLDCSAEEIRSRIVYNVGGDRAERSDDRLELIEKKLNIFRERTAPLIEHYRQQGRILYRIAVTGAMTPADAFAALSSLSAVHPPVTLVAKPPER